MDILQTDEAYMQRCLELAVQARGMTSPNPMVGCVVVSCGRVIGEGFHRHCGGPHAEVNALDSVADPRLLADATLYVSLEPCAHYGKTPPCADRIAALRIPRVVIGSPDPNPKVSGRGVARLRAAGCRVEEGVLRAACDALNRPFLCYHLHHRPYIILKWAESSDGFMDRSRTSRTPAGPCWITGPEERRTVHTWRAASQAIMVGTRTAINDNPALTVRGIPAATGTPMPMPTCYPHPLRIVLDRTLRLPSGLQLFDGTAPTLVVSEQAPSATWTAERRNTMLWRTPFYRDAWLPALMDWLYEHQIQSLLVEGGRQLLQTFIDAGLWDEARVFKGRQPFGEGLQAPRLEQVSVFREVFPASTLHYFYAHG